METPETKTGAEPEQDQQKEAESTEAKQSEISDSSTAEVTTTESEKNHVETREEDDKDSTAPEGFKKPLLIIGPRKGSALHKFKPLNKTEASKKLDEPPPPPVKSSNIPALQAYSDPHKNKEKLIPLPYSEPEWGGNISSEDYSLEILKSGVIIDTVHLNTKPYYIFGRLSNCDVQMNHPSSSRYHAILQYRAVGTEKSPRGFYVYDLGSTHGTFLNKLRLKPKVFAPVKVGHVLKIGGSSRMLILQGPPEDEEPESDLSVTELKQLRIQKEREAELERLRREKEEEAAEQKRRDDIDKAGIDWGMGEDADEETDLTENPFASTTNEELYVADPKKSLRGWYEREGHELNYDVTEKTSGQFLCRVILPIDDAQGRPLVAEALVRGKKKEAVVQCAMEACRILDRHGLLRQSTHEGKQRKKRDWADDDYYDSDEDTFLDRTGSVETKRQRRMAAAGKLETRTETYDSLVQKLEDIQKEISEAESALAIANQKQESSMSANDDQDALDAFMSTLKDTDVAQDKVKRRAAKAHLEKLKQDEVKLRKLANLARPASLPELVAPVSQPSKKLAVMIGTRPSAKPRTATSTSKTYSTVVSVPSTEMDEEEEESDDDDSASKLSQPSESSSKASDTRQTSESVKEHPLPAESPIDDKKSKPRATSMGESAVEHEQTKHKTERKLGPSIPEEFLRQLRGEGGEEETEKKARKRVRNKPNSDQTSKKTATSSSYDDNDPDYSNWVPPTGQTGDGRTKLNEKYGY